MLLDNRVPGLTDPVAQFVVLLGRYLQAVTFRIELPAVIAAPDTVLFNLAVDEIRAAVHAARIKQSGRAVPIPVKDQTFTKNLDMARQFASVPHMAERLPVSAE
jgi:hypothetical protein